MSVNTPSPDPEHASDAASPVQEHAFQAEVARVLSLVVHSVYSDREVFLRELLSNSADACDKLRYEAIGDEAYLGDDPELSVTIVLDKSSRTLTVVDNGIGMTRDELRDNLGTIAKSGTQGFLEALSKRNRKDTPDLIGQFGVGFYSAFMVADHVDVVSTRAGATSAWAWSSNGTGSFTVAPADAIDMEAPARGTAIRLKLKEDASEFLEAERIERIVKTYSDHVAIPIRLVGSDDGGQMNAPRQINTASALWMRPKKDITADQYREFFTQLSGVYGAPALTLHYRAEGRHEYTVLLFVPDKQPFDLYDPDRLGRQKLYVRRVFITDNAALLPGYLRFVRGVIDSEDIPLNISREMLQNNPVVTHLRTAVTKRVLAELKDLSETDAEKFVALWSLYGPVIKEGLYEDPARRDELFALSRFKTTQSGEGFRSLAEYVADMKSNQTAIYYVTGENEAKAAGCPQIEGFRARGIEVLILTDPIDFFWTESALGYAGKPFRSVTRAGDDLDQIPLESDEHHGGKPDGNDPGLATLIAAMKQTLGERICDVRRSKRLTDSAVCLAPPEDGMDRSLERMLARQKTTGVLCSAPILEINPAHPVIAGLAAQARQHGAADFLRDAIKLLLDQAYILEGEPVPDPGVFSRLMNEALLLAAEAKRAKPTHSKGVSSPESP